MKKNIYKLHVFWLDIDTQEESFKPLYLDVNQIIGFNIGDKEKFEGEEEEIATIDIYTNGVMYTIKWEYHIYDFLFETFVLPSVKDGAEPTTWSKISL